MSDGRGTLHQIGDFPFVRDRFHPIAELRAFETRLRSARQADPAFSAAIRARKLPWAKLWTEEIFPLWLYSNYAHLLDEHEFRVMPEGHPVDTELRAQASEVTRVQITTAYPEWDPSGKDARPGGYIRHMELAGINQGVPVFGGGRIGKNGNGHITSRPRARSPDVNRCAWRRGLTKAIKAKTSKSITYAGKLDILLVYAERLGFDTIYETPEDVILQAIEIALSGVKIRPFKKLIVLDPLTYVEFPDV